MTKHPASNDVKIDLPSFIDEDVWICQVCPPPLTHDKKPPSSAVIFFSLPIPPLKRQPPIWWMIKQEYKETHTHIAVFLESTTSHIAIIVLTLIDLSLIIIELVLSSFFPNSETSPHSVHDAENVLSWISIAIASIFTVEQLLKLFVFGPHYFANFWHLFDAFVIITSLVLECVLKGAARETASLLIIFRLWRLVRVVHSIAESLHFESEARLEVHHLHEEKLEKELAEEKEKLRKAEDEVKRLSLIKR